MIFVPRTCQDAPAGIAFFNNISTNLDSMKALLEVWHTQEPAIPLFGIETGISLSAGDSQPGGIHNTPLIAAGLAQGVPGTNLVNQQQTAVRWGVGALGRVRRAAVGQYFLPVFGLSQFWGEVFVAASTDPALSHFARVTVSGVGLLVETFVLGTPAPGSSGFYSGLFMVPADLQFLLLVYAQVAPSLVAPPFFAPPEDFYPDESIDDSTTRKN